MALTRLVLALLISVPIYAQTSRLRVVDASTARPIEYAHIVIQSAEQKSLAISDATGYFTIQHSSPVAITVTFIGYESFKDSISPGTQKDIRLKAGSYSLDDIVVTAQYAPTTASESVLRVKVIDEQSIESKGAVNLSQLLNDQLNIRIQGDGVLGTGIQMQGLSGENVKILIDGVPVIGRLDGQLDLNQINLNTIERIEIIEGPVSVNYGSNALAGAINLITKKDIHEKPTYHFSSFYESVGVYNLDAGVSIPFQKNQQIELNAGRNFFNGWSAIDTGQRAQDWNQKEQLFGTAKYRLKKNRFQLNYSLSAFQEIIKDKGNRRSIFSDYAFDRWYTTYRLDHSIDAKWNLKNAKTLEILAVHNLFRRDNVTYNQNLVDRTQELSSDPSATDTTFAQSFLSRGTYSSPNAESKLSYQLGYELAYEVGSGQRIAGNLQSIGDYAAFGSLRWKIDPSITLQPALRVSYNSAYTSQPVPSIHVNFKPKDKNYSYRASYARGFRAPSIKELYLEFIDANHNIVGNTNLMAEYSHHADLSALFSWGDKRMIHRYELEPMLFYNGLNNLIELAAVSGTQFSYVNINQAQTAGLRTDFKYNIHPDFQFRIGFSTLYQQYSLENSSADFFSPEANFGFEYWRPSKRFGFKLSYKYVGRTPQAQLVGDQVEIGSLEEYHWMDVSANQKIWKDRLSLTVGGRNLFNVTQLLGNASGGVHSSGGSMPLAWGRSLFVGLKFNLL